MIIELYPDYDGFRILYPSATATVFAANAKVMDDKSKASTILKGDVNDDREVDILDYIALQKHIADGSSIINKQNSDMNGDSKINTADLLALRKIILVN